MNLQMNEGLTSENVIIVDAAYIDKVAFNLIVNFERMLGRQIPPADMARWIDCIALDGGLREGASNTQVVLVYEKDRQRLNNFVPDSLDEELNGKAFSDHLGEFVINALPVEEMVSKGDFLLDLLQLSCAQDSVKRVMVVADEGMYDSIRTLLRKVESEKNITVFAMQPMPGGNFKQEILGYSLMNAMGITGEEIAKNIHSS